MLVLVTGATGFIGGNLASRLIETGRQVRAVVRQGSNWQPLADSGVEVQIGSLFDPDFVRGACDGVDVVVNAAGRMGGPGVTHDEMRAVNVDSVETLLAASSEAGVGLFVHCSTPGVIGMVGVAPECMPYRPTGPYERTKCEGEKLVLSFNKNGKLSTSVVRPDFVYGPGDTHKLKMFRAINEGRFPIIGDGRALLHPTFIDDVVDGILLVMESSKSQGQVFNIAGPRPASVAELAGTIAAELGVEMPSCRVPVLPARVAGACIEIGCKLIGREPPVTRYQVNFFTRSHASDISKARQMIGFEPRVELKEGIQRTVNWYREGGHL